MVSEEEFSFDKVTQAVGTICATWAEIEFYLGELVHHLTRVYTGFPTGDLRGIPVFILLRTMDLRQKAQAVQALAHEVKDDDFYKDTASLMDEIVVRLRPIRNRLIHDDWVLTEEGISQVQYVARPFRPQARESRLKLHETIEHKDGEKLDQQLNRFSIALSNLHFLIDRAKVLPSLDPEQGL